MPRGRDHDPELDFWPRKEVTESGCWLWQGAKKANGYGNCTRGKGVIVIVHRYAWELANGRKPPKNRYVCHSCDTPQCFNPAHLFLGTATENMADCIRKGRMDRGEKRSIRVRGENSGNHKLTEEAVRDIRAGVAFGLSRAVAGAPWGVGSSAVAHVVKGRSWKHVAHA